MNGVVEIILANETASTQSTTQPPIVTMNPTLVVTNDSGSRSACLTFLLKCIQLTTC